MLDVTPRYLSSIIKLIMAISFEFTRQAETRTPPVSLGQTGLTGRDNRSDRSNRLQPSWGPPHLNYSLSSPHNLPHPPHAQLELRLFPLSFLTPNPRTQIHPSSLDPRPKGASIGWGIIFSACFLPGWLGFKLLVQGPKVNNIGVGIDLLF